MSKDLAALQDIYSEIRETLPASGNRAYSAVNFSMVQAYWQIGRIIAEHEQNGNLRAEYGSRILQICLERGSSPSFHHRSRNRASYFSDRILLSGGIILYNVYDRQKPGKPERKTERPGKGKKEMKACKFCGTQVDNSEQHCPSCGSAIFLHVCENCGSTFDSAFCPNCGVKAGQVKKICPECRTAYFSNACPNCGYTPSRKPAVQEIVHKHIYEKPEPKPQPAPQPAKKRSGCGCFLSILIWSAVIFFGVRACTSTTSTSRTGTTRTSTTVRTTTSTKTSSSATKKTTATEAPTATPDPETAAAQQAADRYFEKAGEDAVAAVQSASSALYRYQAQKSGKAVIVHKSWSEARERLREGKTEPDYIGLLGYAAAYEGQKLEKNASFGNTPWSVPVYRKDKQFWEEAGTIGHKTMVVVIGQEIEKGKQSYGSTRYTGYLHVIRTDTGEDCWLDIYNFVSTPYWEESLASARVKGYCIATFRQMSDYYPVTSGKTKTVLDDGTKVLLPMKSKIFETSPDKTNNPIAGIVFKEWRNGFGGVTVFFNEEDLTLVY